MNFKLLFLILFVGFFNSTLAYQFNNFNYVPSYASVVKPESTQFKSSFQNPPPKKIMQPSPVQFTGGGNSQQYTMGGMYTKTGSNGNQYSVGAGASGQFGKKPGETFMGGGVRIPF